MKNKQLSTAALKKKATYVFNAWIRNRDNGNNCISCNNQIEQAGHFYSAGHYPALRFNEDNVHGQCVQCNYYKHGNLIKYRERLINKIGIERVERLDYIASIRTMVKDNRFFFEEIINKYKL